MDDLAQIEKRIAGLKEQLDRLQKELAKFEQARSVILLVRGVDKEQSNATVSPETSEWAKLSIVDAAIRVLEGAGGGPLHFDQIAATAIKHGFRIQGKTPHSDAFRRRMGESTKIRNDGGGKYSLAPRR